MSNSYERVFYVCFRRCDQWRWWQILTGKKRQHIFLITSCNKQSCIIIEPSEGGTGLYYIDTTADEVAKEYRDGGADVVRYVAKQKDMERPSNKILRSCVSVVKDFLGIYEFWILTPDQLYKKITKE